MSRTIIRESGIRGIRELAKRYPKAKIYFHQDLDGVTTALAMKKYLENNGIKVVDTEIIQYGDREFAIKKLDAEGDTMPVLVDFAHGKPMFKIHTDHHDTQVGAGDTQSTSFTESPSNVRTISQVVSPKEIFTNTDIDIISTVDAAKFKEKGLKPKDVMNFLFRLDKDASLSQNKVAMGLVANKLLLAYKNKPGFLEYLVMNSEPSLLNILNNIKTYANKAGFAKPEQMAKNQEDYIKAQSESSDVKYEDGIVVQYGGGSMFKPGSYDRYTPFEIYPDADFLVIAWPMGLVQASCNPYKEQRALKGVNLGEIAGELLDQGKSWFESKIVPLSVLKWVSETSVESESVGFTSTDLEAFYPETYKKLENLGDSWERLKKILDTPYPRLTEPELQILDKFGLPLWDIIKANSGGHKCITNISGLNYYGRTKRKPSGGGFRRDDGDDTPYVALTKNIQNKIVEKLKKEIKEKS
jgi:hypothetical protein